MGETRVALIDELNESVKSLEGYNYITRDSYLQREACDNLTALLRRLGDLKQEAIDRGDDDMANTLLGFECSVGFLRASISMWLLLKEGRADDAWRRLVEAQRLVADAVRAHPGFARMAGHGKQLQAIEDLIFPPQKFMSLGMVVRKRLCSICGEVYGECDHLVGRPYMGHLCHTIVSEIEEMNHIAFVDQPADKNARVVEFNVPGGRKNRMTWKVTPGEVAAPDPADGQKGLAVNAILSGDGLLGH